MKECINCNAILEDDELFCHECGTKQEIEEAETQVEETQGPEEKKCVHCGEVIESDSIFCPFCGKSQEVDEVKAEEYQQEPSQDISEQDSSKEDIQPIEEHFYVNEEEEGKSMSWLWVLVALLIAGGIGAWWYMNNENNNSSSLPVPETVVADTIPISSEMEETNDMPSSPLAFLEQFYKGEIGNEGYVKQHVTANVLNKLKRDYEYDCPAGDCLATWVFSAYPPGSDLELEEGPIITKSEDGGKYSVYYSYYTQGQSGRIYKPRGLLLSVIEIDGKYQISDYELVMPDIVQKPNELSNGVDGQYRLRDGRMFLHIEKEGRNIEADFDFRDGAYVSATYTFSCLLDDENKFSSDVHKLNGTYAGKIEGILDNEVMKVDVHVDDKYSDSYEFNLE